MELDTLHAVYAEEYLTYNLQYVEVILTCVFAYCEISFRVVNWV